MDGKEKYGRWRESNTKTVSIEEYKNKWPQVTLVIAFIEETCKIQWYRSYQNQAFEAMQQHDSRDKRKSGSMDKDNQQIMRNNFRERRHIGTQVQRPDGLHLQDIRNSVFDIDYWCVFMFSIRTNNDVEGWHNRVNTRVCTRGPVQSISWLSNYLRKHSIFLYSLR